MSLNKSKTLRTAEKYVLQGKIPAAIDEYRKVVDADRSDLTTINTLGDLYVRAGRIQEAIYNFSRIAESYRDSGFTLKAIAMLKKISKLDPTNVETSMKLANLYSQQGLLVEARQQYLQVADAYARAGQTRKALEAYQKIADLDPSNTSVRMKLGEIYSRERMVDQAHEAFIVAGAEFLRKGDSEQALNANLKAIAINPESRQGLTAIATIYTQVGQADRAINLLCDAFERNPGDVELLTILGRTYLSAGLMDNAERTFLSLVQLDRNRYHYLLEVGRKFLQTGELDRAAEQIDGCLDVLISKREEDKAIEFLRRILDRDMNHLGSLKRLTQIFLRIREDHNLIATLNSLVEAAMRKGEEDEAIAALRELARLEPDQSIHRQRLYNLGVKDIAEGDAQDVVRATGPLDYESAAFDDAFVIRQISEAEILAGHGQVEHSVTILRDILIHAPENVQVHLKLKDIYLRSGVRDLAAKECLELGRIHEARGEFARASDFLAEARQLDPRVDSDGPDQPADESRGSRGRDDHSESLGTSERKAEPAPGHGGFEVREATGGLDLSRYHTGHLSGISGFVTVPDVSAPSAIAEGNSPEEIRSPPTLSYRESLLVEQKKTAPEAKPGSNGVFRTVGDLPSDTMTPELHDELEGIDFYIAQGYVEIARDSLDRLHAEFGDHTEVLSRYQRLGLDVGPGSPAGGDEPASADEVAVDVGDGIGFAYVEPPSSETGNDGATAEPYSDLAGAKEDGSSANEFKVSIPTGGFEPEETEARPFLVHKESGPLNRDLIVRLNTSELLTDTAFGLLPEGHSSTTMGAPLSTGDLIASITANVDDSLGQIEAQASGFATAVESPEYANVESDAPRDWETVSESPRYAQTEPEKRDNEEAITNTNASVEPHQEIPVEGVDEAHAESAGVRDEQDEMQQIFMELAENTDDLAPIGDYETHYSLGLAYKDMDLLDEAIEQFQMAFRVAGLENLQGTYTQCCHMLGVCFERKDLHKVAIMWFQRGLRIQGRPEDEYQALRYEIGVCYEALGETDKAIDALMEVYGVDLNYREVGEKLERLQALKGA
jgi:tetratricopeptide (TPR) repeat protein